MSLKYSAFPIIKISATANDFLLVDLLSAAKSRTNWSVEFGTRARAELVREWCDRHRGLGADGLVFIEPDGEPGVDFAWDFYNSDGNTAEMCGNAARAVSLYVQRSFNKSNLVFRTRAGLVRAKVESGASIEVQLPKVGDVEWNLFSAQPSINYSLIHAGVPHAVVTVKESLARDELRPVAVRVKAEPRFRSSGTNVTFVHQVTESEIESLTFERGVEDFTLSCGTGAVAAAYSLTRGAENHPVEVRVPGGKLFVVWKEGHPILRGPAQIVAEMRIKATEET